MKASKLMDTWIESATTAVQPARELNELTKSTLTKLMEQQMAATKDYLKFGSQGVKALSAVREPRALISQQVELTKEFSSKLLDSTKAYAKLVNSFHGELTSWTEKTAGAVLAKTEVLKSKAVS